MGSEMCIRDSSIHWAQRRTNASVLLDMGPHRGGDLLQFINTMQLRYFGHMARRDNNNLEKSCMLSMMDRRHQEAHWKKNIARGDI